MTSKKQREKYQSSLRVSIRPLTLRLRRSNRLSNVIQTLACIKGYTALKYQRFIPKRYSVAILEFSFTSTSHRYLGEFRPPAE